MAELKIKEFMKESEQVAIDKGFREENVSGTTHCALIMSEVAEIVEELRMGHAPTKNFYREDGKPEGIPSELADVVIRCFEMAEYYGIDLEKAMQEKQAYNKTRPYKHDKLF